MFVKSLVVSTCFVLGIHGMVSEEAPALIANVGGGWIGLAVALQNYWKAKP